MNIPPQVLWKIQQKYKVSQHNLRLATDILERNALRSAASGNFICLSNSKERTEYVIDPVAEKCGCEAGQKEKLCSHLLALLIRQGMFDLAKVEAVAQNNNVLALREELVRIARPKRMEWTEDELDDTPALHSIDEGVLP